MGKESSMVDLDYLKGLSYPDFVGFINQWNVLPGAYTTLSKWIAFSRIAENRIFYSSRVQQAFNHGKFHH